MDIYWTCGLLCSLGGFGLEKKCTIKHVKIPSHLNTNMISFQFPHWLVVVGSYNPSGILVDTSRPLRLIILSNVMMKAKF